MSTAFDALPAIVPFFGVLLSSFTVGFCIMNRRIARLQIRVETLETTRNSVPQIVIEQSRPAPPTPPAPPTIVQPPIYPYPTQQPYPYYQSYPPPRPSAPYSFANDPQNQTI